VCKPYAKDKEALRAKLLATTLSLDKLLRLEQLEWAVGLEAALGGGAAAGMAAAAAAGAGAGAGAAAGAGAGGGAGAAAGMAAATAGAGYGAGSYTRPLFGST